VIVGIQPEVAFTMVRLGVGPGHVPTALDLEEGLQLLETLVGPPAAAIRDADVEDRP
jgi:rsbT antagonist protein RsbS